VKRREFITLLGGAAATWPLAARTQQSAMPVIGFLSGRSPGESAAVVNAFRQGLAENGYVEAKDIAIEFRWADGRYDRLAALATELVARQVEVIAATGGSVSGLAAKSATGTIPIVFSSGGDAVKLGLVASLNPPGGNVTGVNLVFGALGAKRLELLHSLVPAAAAIAMLVNPNYPSAASEVQDVEAAGRTLGLRISIFKARTERNSNPPLLPLPSKRRQRCLLPTILTL
jgi:putative tryptophan/tyrosine transport system substrate-binding protein